uniref:DUF4139 domain-containing protein n=1 Tax=uncultured bacterium contig00030 TaxID=1181519 RepID=A0A806KEB3_9BACT|nr:hypothetical protein [uncultured bacterium contig00030]
MNKKNILTAFAFCFFTACIFAQGIQGAALQAGEGQLPLKKVVILTSGLAYYEHSGPLGGNTSITLPFRLDAVNDALKTLVINDPSSANPSVTYQSENTLIQTLRSLTIDLSYNPGLADILLRLRGSEVEITAPTVYTGRITGIENRQSMMSPVSVTAEPWLLLSTADGIRLFNLNEISSIKFKDSVIEQDLGRSLDLLASSRNSFSRQLLVNLPGTGRRDVSISYVIPSPVWKVSYRLDLGTANSSASQTALFQGWAIVDNDSDTDWSNVQLSLVAGRPSSFIQNLYPPYYVTRPVLPLSIAGTAEAAAHDSAVTYDQSASAVYSARTAREPAPSAAFRDMSNLLGERHEEAEAQKAMGGSIETAAGSAAGGQFEFTVKNPVSLDRRMSAMLPLVESQIEGRRVLIYNGRGSSPRLGAVITNTAGMKLPAGPITVYDGGVYAGDALIEFWNENEMRLISFGEDLSVTASASDTNTRIVSSVVVSGGVMTINRNLAFIKTYTFINSDSASKQLVIEHNKTAQTELVSPSANEQTTAAYRFNVTLPAKQETVLTVTEQRPVFERITLLSLRPEAFLSYAANQEIPQRVRDALQRAVTLKQAADNAALSVRNIETQRERLIGDQDRIRRNLEAAGNQTQQGQEYLRRLVALDGEIDAMTPNLEKERNNARAAQQEYENYLNNLNLQ